MKDDKPLSALISSVLKRNRLKDLEDFAREGNTLTQFMLGEMYFFSIAPQEYYLEDLFEITGMDIAIRKTRGKRSSLKNFYNRVAVGFCTGEPDLDKALRWYKEAALSGSTSAIQRIEQIEKGEVPRHQNGKRIMQFFGIDYSPGSKENLTYKVSENN